MKRSPPPERRTPLNPGTKGLAAGKPLTRGKPLAGKATLQRGGPIPQISDKRKAENAERRALPKPTRCEIRDVLLSEGVPLALRLTDIRECHGPLHWHERRKRSAGGSITNPDNMMGACSAHNEFVETFPLVARLYGARLVCREGDEAYEELGARKSRLDRSP